MLSKLKKSKFFKNSILYTIGGMMTPIIGFIMLPIYTNYLVPAEYGIMTTIQSLVGMFQVFLLLSLHGAVTRFYYDYLDNEKKQKEYLGTIFTFVIIFSTVAAALLLLFNEQIGSILFGDIPIKPYYFYMVILSWVSAILALPLALLRAQEKAASFVIINIVKAFIIMLLSIYFIIERGLGAESALLSQVIVTGIVVVYLIIKQLKYLKISFNIKYINSSLIFSLPLLPHVASGWIIKSSDRIILEKFVSLDDIGIYALAAQISAILALFYTSINNALVPRYTKLRVDSKIREANRLLKIFSCIILFFGILSIPIAMVGATLLSSDAYNSAIWLIPLLIIGEMIKGFYFIPVAKLFYNKKTRLIASSSTVAAIVNIVVNFTFIPIVGIFGAIISTILAEITRMVLIYRASLKNREENI
ncbi:lipopolysaccharide biosynthesis protein [Paraliobacillus sediminis]|uniref:lipopolysaccharide biosynthesis protein n=1 Tax=Paraliobacillus sediminis TaxID=1885916 RepID=UPI000E3CD919|nr:oligosaccharide flippase family protein [Paraliobacillus sediminis]